MAEWKDLIEELNTLDGFAKRIQDSPQFLPQQFVTEDEIEQFRMNYIKWYADSLSKLEGDLKNQFRLNHERLAGPFVSCPNNIYPEEQLIEIGRQMLPIDRKYQFSKPYKLYFQPAAHAYKIILFQAQNIQKEQKSRKALEMINRNISLFGDAIAEANATSIFSSNYHKAYYSTESLLNELFSEKEVDRFRISTRTYTAFDDPYSRLQDYKEHISLCILQLEIYRDRIENFGITKVIDQQEKNAPHIYTKEFHMGDVINTSMGNVTNNGGQLFTGKFNQVVANLAASNQKDLADTLEHLKSAVIKSSCLTEEEKQDHIDVITEIGEQSASSQPNKAKLKRLSQGLISGLKAVPDIVKAITAAEPLLEHLHMHL